MMVCIMGWTRLGVTLFAMHKDGLDFWDMFWGLMG